MAEGWKIVAKQGPISVLGIELEAGETALVFEDEKGERYAVKTGDWDFVRGCPKAVVHYTSVDMDDEDGDEDDGEDSDWDVYEEHEKLLDEGTHLALEDLPMATIDDLRVRESVVVANVHENVGNMRITEEALTQALEAEYRYRNEPFEQRFAAMVIAAMYEKVPAKVVVDVRK